jgi:hypothetical protein
VAPPIVAALLAISGCGRGDGARVEGKLVHKDGTPLVGARVVLRSKQGGKSVYGSTDDSGLFQLEVPVGENGAAADYDVMIVEALGDPDHPRPSTIAAKYLDGAKSGLKVTVQPGERTRFDATLDPP